MKQKTVCIVEVLWKFCTKKSLKRRPIVEQIELLGRLVDTIVYSWVSHKLSILLHI